MASKIGAALGFGDLTDASAGDPTGLPESEVDAEQEPDQDADDSLNGPSSVEVLAMQTFEKAKTPADKAKAMKDFLVACGLTGSGY